MSFNIKKQKIAKKIVKTVNKTIEAIHDERMKVFSSNRTQIEKIKKSKGDKSKMYVLQDMETSYFLQISEILHEYCDLKENDIERKAELTKLYYSRLDLKYHTCDNSEHTPENYSFCPQCKTEKLITHERYLTCTTCGSVDSEKILDGLNYQDECSIKQVFVFDYKRINYFTEWLTQIQANETTDIPNELLEDVKLELRKRNIIDTSKLNITTVKKILKEINSTKYYEHIPLIISKLSNSKPLYIPEDLCSEFKKMFLMLQQPFEKFKGTRKSFLSYPYVLYKFCEMLGLTSYLQYFTLLKSREKLLKTDVLWRSIVDEIYKSTGDSTWTFIPSC